MIVNDNAAIVPPLEEVAQLAPLAPANSIEQVIRKDFSSIPEIRDLRIEHENGETLVWIAMENPPRSLRYKVYEMQAELAAAFTEALLNFNLIPA